MRPLGKPDRRPLEEERAPKTTQGARQDQLSGFNHTALSRGLGSVARLSRITSTVALLTRRTDAYKGAVWQNAPLKRLADVRSPRTGYMLLA